MTKAPEPKSGDHVSWKSHGGEAHGKVVKKITAPTTIKGHKAAASKHNPEFIVETDDGKRDGGKRDGGKRAAHKAGALTRQ